MISIKQVEKLQKLYYDYEKAMLPETHVINLIGTFKGMPSDKIMPSSHFLRNAAFIWPTLYYSQKTWHYEDDEGFKCKLSWKIIMKTANGIYNELHHNKRAS